MRNLLWFVSLFALAVATALFFGHNDGTVTLFWPPYRVDISLNLALISLVALFFVFYFALRVLAFLLTMPGQAKRWRIQTKERAIQSDLVDALLHLVAGRFIRARKSAEQVLAQERALSRNEKALSYGGRLRAMAHLLAAESSHALQDRARRDEHVNQALAQSARRHEQDVRDGLNLRAARWAFDDRNEEVAQSRLDELSSGAARRTLALRLRFKVARLARQSKTALEIVRLLVKHRAFSPLSAQSLVRVLASEMIGASHDPEQLGKAWNQLDPSERLIPDVAVAAADRMLTLSGEVATAQRWLIPVWDQMVKADSKLSQEQRIKLTLVLQRSFAVDTKKPAAEWLSRIELAQMASPRDALLQYLAGVTCLHLSLWGKSQQLLKQALSQLQDERLKRRAWAAMAHLAEQRDDLKAATEAWKQAAKI